MPFEEERPPYIYTGIVKGLFWVKAKDDDHNEKIVDRKIVDRATAEVTIVRGYQYKKLSKVFLVDIKESFHEKYKHSWEFYLLDGNQYVCWKMSKKSPIGAMFLKRIENLILDTPFTLVAGWDKENEKSMVGVWQNEGWVPSKYPKPKEGEPPSELPQPTQDEDGDWDWSEPNKFWHKMVEEIRPFLSGMDPAAQQVAVEQAREEPEGHLPPETKEDIAPEPEILPPSQEPPDDDLPF